MKKISLLAAMTAAVALSSQVVAADDVNSNNSPSSVSSDKGNCSSDKSSCSGSDQASNANEKCVPIVNGKNIVIANKGQCASGKHSCAGQNDAGEADAWVYVPKGVCDRIKAGDFSDVPDSVRSSLDIGMPVDTSMSDMSSNITSDSNANADGFFQNMMNTVKSWFN